MTAVQLALGELAPVSAPVRHPARFTAAILEVVESLLVAHRFDGRILDPFAGTGLVHRLPWPTVGVELEPEWAYQHPATVTGSALALPFPDGSFDAIVTSPAYGNRMADHHEARDASTRHTYRHALGRPLHPDNAGAFQWGEQYRAFHESAWAEATRVVRPGGLFVLNTKNHVRAGVVQPVTEWHVGTLQASGWRLLDRVRVAVSGVRHGANADVRVDFETVHLFRRAPAHVEPSPLTDRRTRCLAD